MTQVAFIKAYMGELRARYAWTSDLAKFARFMEGVTLTLRSDSRVWTPEGEAVTAAWKAIGQTGKPSIKAIRALPLN